VNGGQSASTFSITAPYQAIESQRGSGRAAAAAPSTPIAWISRYTTSSDGHPEAP
jgi:hypothetical protein